jgi:hypothetical protein
LKGFFSGVHSNQIMALPGRMERFGGGFLSLKTRLPDWRGFSRNGVFSGVLLVALGQKWPKPRLRAAGPE